MKKVIATLLAGLMLAGTVAGCSSQPSGNNPSKTDTESTGGNTGEEITLKLAIFKGGYGDSYWTPVQEAFQKEYPNVKFEVQLDEQIGDLVKTQLNAGNVPDFIYCASNNTSGLMQAMIKSKQLMDITDLFEGELKEKIIPGFTDSATLQPYGDGKVYAAPIYYSTNGLWYNKTLFEEANLKVPTTLDEFWALGEQLNSGELLGKKRSLFTWQGQNPGYMETPILTTLLNHAGEDAVNAAFNFEDGAWSKDAMKEGLAFLPKLYNYTAEGVTGMEFTACEALVKTGEALFVPCGNWIIGELEKIDGEVINGKDFEWGFAPVPVMDASKDKYIYSTVEEMYIPKDAKNADMAKKFLAFQYSDEAIKLNAEKTGGIPPVLGAAEKVKDTIIAKSGVSSYDAFSSFDQGYKAYMKGFATVDSNINPKKEFYSPVASVMDGSKSIDEWTKEADDRAAQLKDKIVK